MNTVHTGKRKRLVIDLTRCSGSTCIAGWWELCRCIRNASSAVAKFLRTLRARLADTCELLQPRQRPQRRQIRPLLLPRAQYVWHALIKAHPCGTGAILPPGVSMSLSLLVRRFVETVC